MAHIKDNLKNNLDSSTINNFLGKLSNTNFDNLNSLSAVSATDTESLSNLLNNTSSITGIYVGDYPQESHVSPSIGTDLVWDNTSTTTPYSPYSGISISDISDNYLRTTFDIDRVFVQTTEFGLISLQDYIKKIATAMAKDLIKVELEPYGELLASLEEIKRDLMADKLAQLSE